MKLLKSWIVGTLAILVLVLMVGCTTSNDNVDDTAMEDKTVETTTDTSMEEGELELTLEELKQYDGQNGNPAYVAVDGIIYDVTTFAKWAGGKHNGHFAGNDLSNVIDTAPHGRSKLKILPVVGKIVE